MEVPSDGGPRMHGIWRDILPSEGPSGMEGKMKRRGGQITRKVDDNEIFTIIRGGPY